MLTTDTTLWIAILVILSIVICTNEFSVTDIILWIVASVILGIAIGEFDDYLNRKFKNENSYNVRQFRLNQAVGNPEELKKVIKEEYGYEYDLKNTDIYSSKEFKGVVKRNELLFITHSDGLITRLYVLNTSTGEVTINFKEEEK